MAPPERPPLLLLDVVGEPVLVGLLPKTDDDSASEGKLSPGLSAYELSPALFF